MTSPAKVFVSYSWKVERDTGIVNELEQLCRERDIQLVRDSSTMQHGDLIRDFMDRLAGGEHIITVFSDAYFKSAWCMYELLTTWQRGDFKNRTHPIKVDGIDLQDDDCRIDLTEFWETKYESAKSKLAGRDPTVFIEEHKRVKLCRDIYQNINELINFAASRLTTPLDQLKAQQYSQLLDQIRPQGIDEHGQADNGFLAEIKALLAVDLKKSELFREHIIKSCGLNVTDDDGLHGYLIDQCLDGQFVEIIQNLQSAFVNSFDELDGSDITGIRKLYQAAEDALAKLVLFNVKNEWMAQHRKECMRNDGYEQVLPDMSFGGVEVVVSRDAQTIPRFRYAPHDLNLQGGKGVTLESGYRSKDVVRDVIKRLFYRVMEQDISSQVDEKHALDILQRTIKQRKQQKNLKLRKNYFLLFPDDSDSPLSDAAVQKEIRTLLPDLSFIRIKSGINEETFIVEDAELMVAISDFYKTLEEYKLK
ncbi:MAG: toll/interleukin-1 receptor domain-containing protein [Burkholderiales bacterium]|nr:toll/interleukin-1 receptor domain-containing protein [Burkholderiales bacterium]